jgi:hypothetical protein
MAKSASLLAVVLATAMLVQVGGCGSKQEYGEVEGVVTLDGQPLANAEVVFLPDPEKGNTGRRSIALTDAQGRYRVSSDAGRAGAPLGYHRVCINDLLAGPPGAPAPLVEGSAETAGSVKPPSQPQKQSKSRFPVEYGSAQSTPLRDIEIKSGSQTINLKVKGKLAR